MPWWVLIALIPLILLIVFSFKFDSGSPVDMYASDRTLYYVIVGPIAIIFSLTIMLGYWVGRAKGWIQ